MTTLYEKYDVLEADPEDVPQVIVDSLVSGATSPAYFIRWVVAQCIAASKALSTRHVSMVYMRLTLRVALKLVQQGHVHLLEQMCDKGVMANPDGVDLITSVVNPIEELLNMLQSFGPGPGAMAFPSSMPGAPMDWPTKQQPRGDTSQATNHLLKSLDLPS